MNGQNYICIHGHFYQPPRENPFTGVIEERVVTAPYANWNERINDECYRPNTAARILDKHGLLLKRINNYEWISFNFGPTFLNWLEENDPQTYGAIIDADRWSAENFGGHGSAMAQAYNHTILPLSNSRDRRTQVKWGIADFVNRYGRRPEGMWLPETAVDLETLEVLADEGILFTVLSPYQAEAVRSTEVDWRDVTGGKIDTRVPYRVDLRGGKEIAVFFYNGALSTAIAFNGLLDDGSLLAKRLIHELGNDGGGPRLSHVATDGETYGHHHRFGEMALAAAIEEIRHDPDVSLTNYGQYLEIHRPTLEARILENTAWSCAHGLERWRSDCGCAPQDHPEWSQAWRTPLREALDWLRDQLIEDFENAGTELLESPWDARDAYIDLILGDSTETFADRHCRDGSNSEDRQRALDLLEIQHRAMLMYTSCAWFFDDIDRLEAMFALRQAGRAIDLTRQVLGKDYESEFVKRLEKISSNADGSGRDVYEREVAPHMSVE